MKNCLLNLVLLGLVTLWLGCQQETSHDSAGNDHDHDVTEDATEETDVHDSDAHAHEEKTPGPNGGRLIASVSPSIEFLVTDERRVKLTFVDSAAKPIEAPEASFSLTGGDRQSPIELSFNQEGESYLSNEALPEGTVVPVILSISLSGANEPTLERFNVDFSICSECQLVEYACICDH